MNATFFFAANNSSWVLPVCLAVGLAVVVAVATAVSVWLCRKQRKESAGSKTVTLSECQAALCESPDDGNPPVGDT